MPSLENAALRVTFNPRTSRILLDDRRRHTRWMADSFTYVLNSPKPTRHPLPPARFRRTGEGVTADYDTPAGLIRIRWELNRDHLRVLLLSAPDTARVIDLPGIFRPLRSRPRLLVPVYQGVLYQGGDQPWEEIQEPGGHCRLSLSFLALLAETGGLLYTAETPTDWRGRFGDDARGPYATIQVERCPVNGWFEREVRLYPVPADPVAIALRYRRRVQERNEFVGWDEKIDRKPILKKLFGACMAFIGYNRAPRLDYVAGARRLREFGFRSVLYYPVRMCNYSLDFLMGGDAPIWLSDREIARIHQVPGALVAPWGWYHEGLDDGSPRRRRLFKHSAEGAPYDGWRIEQQQWKLICTPYQIEESRRRFRGDMKAMDWIHYDVTATSIGKEPCFRADHALHDGRPIGRREEWREILRLLGPETNGDRIVSSEGFTDRLTPAYDIGSSKLTVDPRNRTALPLPLTSLVFHDSTIHDWWEIHNYNVTPGFSVQCGRFGAFGNGWGAQKAAQDALYGQPPNVFPFGRQYGWTDVHSRRTFSFQIHVDDRAVQEALALALPVARLHARIGRCAMTDFECLSDDGLLQASRFSDGTRIIANLSDRPRDLPGGRPLAAHQWIQRRE